MHSSTVLTIALAAAGAQANLYKRAANQTLDQVEDYVNEVCLGYNPETAPEDFVPDFNLPCYAINYIEQECLYGSVAAQQMFNTSNNDTYYSDNENSPRDQQICFCQSQYFDQLDGCYDCLDKHGLLKFLDDANDLPAPSAISSFSASYCQATNTATVGFDEALESAFPESSASSSYGTGIRSYSSDLSPTYSFTDPIGNKTDVSLYFTPSVTGTAAYAFSEASPTGSSSRAHLFPGSSTLSVSSPTASGSSTAQTTTFATNSAGQIVATAGQSNAASSSTRSGAAVATAAADKFALAGVFGMAAVVAYL